jgi:hypothetical protein
LSATASGVAPSQRRSKAALAASHHDAADCEKRYGGVDSVTWMVHPPASLSNVSSASSAASPSHASESVTQGAAPTGPTTLRPLARQPSPARSAAHACSCCCSMAPPRA